MNHIIEPHGGVLCELMVANSKRKQIQKEHDVVLAGGYGPQQGKIFRIGHLGYVKPKEIDETINAINLTLKSF